MYWEERAKRLRKTYNIPNDIPDGVISYCTQTVEEGDSKYKIIKIDDLKNYFTACGSNNRKCFTKRIIKFLKKHCSIDYVVAELNIDDDSIQNLAVKYKGSYTRQQYFDITNAFSEMIDNNDGSLRCEESEEKDKKHRWWDCYESE